MHYSHEYMRQKSSTQLSYDAAAIDSLIEEGFKKQELVEYSSLLDDLKVLDEWCKLNGKDEFFQYFQDAMVGAFYRFARTKKKAWTPKRERIKNICSALLPVFSAGVLTAATTFTTNLVSGDAVLPDNIMQCIKWGIAIGAIVISWLAMHVFKETHNKRNYDETWVRHSLCNSRLRLAMSTFLTSDRADTDYQKFVDSTFAILEQNIDQFAVNMCPNGMASRV